MAQRVSAGPKSHPGGASGAWHSGLLQEVHIFPCLGCSITSDLFFLEGSRMSAALGWSKLWLLYPELCVLVLTDYLFGGF